MRKRYSTSRTTCRISRTARPRLIATGSIPPRNTLWKIGLMIDMTASSGHEVAAMVGARRLSAVEVTTAALSRIDQFDRKLRAFIVVNPKAIQEAERVDH